MRYRCPCTVASPRNAELQYWQRNTILSFSTLYQNRTNWQENLRKSFFHWVIAINVSSASLRLHPSLMSVQSVKALHRWPMKTAVKFDDDEKLPPGQSLRTSISDSSSSLPKVSAVAIHRCYWSLLHSELKVIYLPWLWARGMWWEAVNPYR